MKHWIWAAALALITSAWAAPDWTQAQIVKIDPEKRRVVLKHERIQSVGMAAMTMPFKADESVPLDTFKAGQKVRFTVALRDEHLVVDRMEQTR